FNLDAAGRDRHGIALSWIRQMKSAIKERDPERLVTVGQSPLLGAIETSGFSPARVSEEVDFISVHLNPQPGIIDNFLVLLITLHVGLPVRMVGIFPVVIDLDAYCAVLDASEGTAAGWLTYYWGESPEVLEVLGEPRARRIRDALAVFTEFMASL